jgi:hypothetical protein
MLLSFDELGRDGDIEPIQRKATGKSAIQAVYRSLNNE